MEKKIPILAIVGFLGSGKTSLLNHLLADNQGLKIGVIVNDFGAINIDAMLVAKQTDSKLELSNGCICCAVGEGGLDDALSQIAHGGSLIDYIIIEASGLAEPHELAFILEQSKNKYAKLDSIVAVVDAETVLETSEKHPGFFKQLDIADVIIVNKTDLVAPAKLKNVIGYLEFLNNRARIQQATHGVVDTRFLLDTDAVVKRERVGAQLQLGATDADDHSQHLHESFQKYSFSTNKAVDPKAFEHYMHDGIDKRIYRAKGFVYFGMKGYEQKFVFQLVGARVIMKLDDWRGQKPSTDIVFIGKDFDTERLKQDLLGLIDPKPEDISGALMDIFAYK